MSCAFRERSKCGDVFKLRRAQGSGPVSSRRSLSMLRKLEKYEILEEIGHGGMATVYRATDTVLDRPVALKVMHPHLQAAEEARRRFHREARSVARLRHPRVLEIYDFSGEGSSEAYIAAELLTGPTLKQWREAQHELPAEIAACAAIQVAQALEAAHEAGIVHRDVKPENVLLHENRELKLTDFGIADMLDAQSMTATGQILGSPGHMAPEQIEGGDCDARTDLFSLGTVLYYLATGHLPFTGRNPHQVLKRIVDGEYADPLRVNPAIGGRLRAIIVKSLERDPADRYQSASELITDLEEFIAEVGITDADAMLERYLKDPEGVGAEIRRQSIEHLIERGELASHAGDLPLALDYYNRVLALDEGNERVLRLIERAGTDRRRRTMMLTGGALMTFGAIMGLAAWTLWAEPTLDESSEPVGSPPPPSDAGVALGPVTDPDVEDSEPMDPTPAEEPAEVERASSPSPEDSIVLRPATVRVAARRGKMMVRERPRKTRWVVLAPSPQNVRIGIDGSPPQPFRTVVPVRQELSVGAHTFVVEPDEGVGGRYERRIFRDVRIQPGEGDQILHLDLPLARARLLVRSRVPANVTIVGPDRQGRLRTRASGRANEVLFVEMHRPRENLRVNVTAPGYEPYRSEPLSFSAGGATAQIEVDLVPTSSEP